MPTSKVGGTRNGRARCSEIGTPEQPIAAKHTAILRLHYVAGMDKQSCPAIVCCGGRMDFHGTAMNRTWLKLSATAKKPAQPTLQSKKPSPAGRSAIASSSRRPSRQNKVKKTFQPSVKDNTQTEERIIKAIAGTIITLDRHPSSLITKATAAYRAGVANLSRNATDVGVESANLPTPPE